jgi:hypothetical protein
MQGMSLTFKVVHLLLWLHHVLAQLLFSFTKSIWNRFYPDLKHMGEPLARKAILEWVGKLFESVPANSSKALENGDAKAAALSNGYGH